VHPWRFTKKKPAKKAVKQQQEEKSISTDTTEKPKKSLTPSNAVRLPPIRSKK